MSQVYSSVDHLIGRRNDLRRRFLKPTSQISIEPLGNDVGPTRSQVFMPGINRLIILTEKMRNNL